MSQQAASYARDAGREAALSVALAHTRFGHPLYAFRAVDSTMNMAHALALQGAPEGTVIWAASQQAGRGRQGRVWESPEGGIYLSLITRPWRPAAEVPQLSLVAGLVAAHAIEQATGATPMVRWPNDILLGGRKVAGILVEAKHGAVVIGMGVNVTTPSHALPPTATSLSTQGATVDPDALTSALCQRFGTWYDAWLLDGFHPIREALRPLVGLFGQVVRISAGTSQFEGTATDLDEAGALVVRLDSGVTRAVQIGEVSLLTQERSPG